MVVCPHCQQRGVSAWAARWARRERPATCTLCGGLSHTLASTGSGIPAATCTIAGAFFLLGTQSHLMVLAWLGIPLAVAFNIWAWRRVKLVPISQGRAATARRAGWVVNMLAVLGTLFH